MFQDNRKLVVRGETRYLEERLERMRATGYLDDVYTKLKELGDKTVTDAFIRIYDISINKNVAITDRLFRYGPNFRNLRWRRNTKVEFDGTVYRLTKCKGKNSQKPGRAILFEIRNPKNVVVVARYTNNRYRAKVQPKSRTQGKRRPQLHIPKCASQKVLSQAADRLLRSCGEF